jgi:hypothetical protein
MVRKPTNKIIHGKKYFVVVIYEELIISNFLVIFMTTDIFVIVTI